MHLTFSNRGIVLKPLQQNLGDLSECTDIVQLYYLTQQPCSHLLCSRLENLHGMRVINSI